MNNIAQIMFTRKTDLMNHVSFVTSCDLISWGRTNSRYSGAVGDICSVTEAELGGVTKSAFSVKVFTYD